MKNNFRNGIGTRPSEILTADINIETVSFMAGTNMITENDTFAAFGDQTRNNNIKDFRKIQSFVRVFVVGVLFSFWFNFARININLTLVKSNFNNTVFDKTNTEEYDLLLHNIKSLKYYQEAYQHSLKFENQYLCLIPDSSIRYKDFSKIPRKIITVETMNEERQRGNVFSMVGKYGRTGNRIQQMTNQLNASIVCNKITLLLENEFAPFFTPCYDFRVSRNHTPLQQQRNNIEGFCGQLTKRLVAIKGIDNEINPAWVFRMNRQLSGFGMDLMRFHLGNVKGAFLSRPCNVPTVPTIVLQIRGQDVFAPVPNKEYGQPPLDFYVQAVKHSRADEVVVIAQDKVNPLYDALQYFKWSETKSNTNNVSRLIIYDDMDFDQVLHTFMCAETIVCAVSTLCDLFLLSSNSRYLYSAKSKLILPQHDMLGAWMYEIDGNHSYSPFIGWNNTPNQRKEMLEFEGGTLKSMLLSP